MKKQITIILTLLAFSLSAQTTSKMYVVKNSAKFLPSELIGKDIRDANGEVCAGVVVVSDLQGLSFQSYNGIVKTNSNPGRHFIFVSPTERVVEIFKSGYEPLKIILRNYGINLKSGKTWQIKITGDKKTGNLIPISIISQPSGAEIFIDGVSQGTGTTFKTTKGKHTIKFVKNGHKTITKTIDVSDNNILFNSTLTTIDPVPVKFESIPQGASLFVNSEDKGKTPTAKFLFPGLYNIRLSLSGYLPVSNKIDITETGENNFAYTLTKNIGTLNLSVTPKDAKILLNKEDYTNKSSIELAPSTYKLEISKNGFYSSSEIFEIKLGETVNKKIRLIEKLGDLQFSIEPFDAKIKLLRANKTANSWSGLKILKNIPVGTYTIEAKANGYKTYTKTIEIKESITEKINIVMEKGSNCGTQVTYSGKTYNTVQIGTQCWFKENLDVGTMMQSTIGDFQQTDNGVIEKYCYNNDENNCDTYGGLYEWIEAMQYVTTEGAQGICPSGWHIPTEVEMQTLQTYVNNEAVKLIDQSQTMTDGLIPTNETGFSALFAGGRHYHNGDFGSLGGTTYFWSSTEDSSSNASRMYLYYTHSHVYFTNNNKSFGFSVRCLKD